MATYQGHPVPGFTSRRGGDADADADADGYPGHGWSPPPWLHPAVAAAAAASPGRNKFNEPLFDTAF